MICDYLRTPEVLGQRRGCYDIISWHEQEVRRTAMHTGFRAVFLPRTKFVKHYMEEHRCAAQDAEDEWSKRLADASEKEKDKGGPPDEPERLATVLEKYIDGFTSVEQVKAMTLGSKQGAIKNEQQVGEGRDSLKKGHVDFENPMFQELGGNIHKQLDNQTKAGHNAATGQKAIANVGADGIKVPTEESKSNVRKKVKVFDKDRDGLALDGVVEREVTKATNAITKAFDAFDISQQMATAAEDTVDKLREFVAIMIKKKETMKVLAVSLKGFTHHGVAEPAIEVLDTDLEHKQLHLMSTMLESEGLPGTEVDTEKVTSIIAGHFSERKQRLSLVLRCHQWDAQKKSFQAVLDSKTFFKCIQQLKLAVASEVNLARYLKVKMEQREPLPITDCDNLTTVAAMEFQRSVAVKAVVSQEEAQQVKTLEVLQSKAIVEVAKKAEQAASDVKKLIENKMKKDQEKEEKVKFLAEKEELKKQKAQAKSAARIQRTAAKRSANSAMSRAPATGSQMPCVPPLLLDSSKVQAMKVFATVQEVVSQFGGDDYGKPYVVQKHDALAQLVAEKTLAAVFNIFKVQIPSFDTAKDTGRACQGLMSDRKGRCTELMRELVPDDVLPGAMKTWPPAVQQNVNSIHLWGCTERMVGIGPERNALGNIRFQPFGEREVVVLRYDAIKEMIGRKVKNGSPEKFKGDMTVDIIEKVQQKLEGIKADDFEEAELQAAVWKHLMKPGESMVIPPGCFVLERVIAPANVATLDRAGLRNVYAVGLRIHWMEPVDRAGTKAWKILIDDHLALGLRPRDPTGSFWSLVHKGVVAASGGFAAAPAPVGATRISPVKKREVKREGGQAESEPAKRAKAEPLPSNAKQMALAVTQDSR